LTLEGTDLLADGGLSDFVDLRGFGEAFGFSEVTKYFQTFDLHTSEPGSKQPEETKSNLSGGIGGKFWRGKWPQKTEEDAKKKIQEAERRENQTTGKEPASGI
jgi:hypothetical protein